MQSKVAGVHWTVGSVDQVNIAMHKRLGGMDAATKAGHLSGGLPNTRKKMVAQKKRECTASARKGDVNCSAHQILTTVAQHLIRPQFANVRVDNAIAQSSFTKG